MHRPNLSRFLYRAQVRIGLTRSEFRGTLILLGLLAAGVLAQNWRHRVPAIDQAIYRDIEAEFERRSWRTPLPDPIGPPGPKGLPEPSVDLVTALPPDQLLDLNAATSEQLQGLPRIGPRTAARILKHRTQYGPFQIVDDLLMIQGIGPATLANLRPFVTVAPKAGRLP